MRILDLNKTLLFAAIAAVCVLSAPAAQASGGLRLDRAFGHHGIAEPRLGPAFGSSQFVSAHVNADGSVLAAWHEGQNGEGVATVRLYGADGALVRTVETRYEQSAPEVVDAEGRYLAGEGNYVTRFLADGTPDPSFGELDAHGKRLSDWIRCEVQAVLPLPSGQIIAGSSQCLARFDQDGKLDPSFGEKGVLDLGSLGVKGWRLRLAGIAPGSGGDVILAINRFRSDGSGGEGKVQDGSLVVAVTPTAGLDPSWGQGGIVDSSLSLGAISPVAGGGVLLAGEQWGRKLSDLKAESDAVVVQLGPDGRPSAGFGSGGMATLDLGGVDLVHAMAVQPDGGIVIGGVATRLTLVCTDYWEQMCDEIPFVARFRADGSRDAAYGRDGVSEPSALTAPFAPIEGVGVLGLSPRPDGGVLAWGGAGINAFLAALGPDGSLDPGFGEAGVRVEQRKAKSSAAAHVLGVDRRGRVLVLGATTSGVAPEAPSGAVFRFRRDGELDRSFGTGGFVRVPGNARALAVGPDGGAYVLSGEFGPNLVSHVTAGGRLDQQFGVEGSAPLPPTPPIVRRGKARATEFDPRALVVLPDGGVLVGGESGEAYAGSAVRMAVMKLNRRGRLAPSFGRRGIATLAFGQRGNCNLTAMAAGPGGRVLLAGKIRVGRAQRRTLAVAVIRRDGSPDHSFGTAGLARAPLRGESRVTAITADGNAIIAAGDGGRYGRVRRVLLRFSADGRLDGGFARRVAKSWSRSPDPGYVPEPSQVLVVGRDLIVVSRGAPSLTVFSHSGDYRGAISEDPKVRPPKRIAAATVQAGRLVVATNLKVGSRRSAFILRRFQPR